MSGKKNELREVVLVAFQSPVRKFPQDPRLFPDICTNSHITLSFPLLVADFPLHRDRFKIRLVLDPFRNVSLLVAHPLHPPEPGPPYSDAVYNSINRPTHQRTAEFTFRYLQLSSRSPPGNKFVTFSGYQTHMITVLRNFMLFYNYYSIFKHTFSAN